MKDQQADLEDKKQDYEDAKKDSGVIDDTKECTTTDMFISREAQLDVRREINGRVNTSALLAHLPHLYASVRLGEKGGWNGVLFPSSPPSHRPFPVQARRGGVGGMDVRWAALLHVNPFSRERYSVLSICKPSIGACLMCVYD